MSWPFSRRQADRLSLPVEMDGRINLSDVVVPTLNVGLEAPTVPGTGPRIRPRSIDAQGIAASNDAANQVALALSEDRTGGGGNPTQVGWSSFTPVQVAADAIGGIGAPVAIAAAPAALARMVRIWFLVDTAGAYTFDFIENTAVPANLVPPWTGVPFTLAAGDILGPIVLSCPTQAVDFGHNAGGPGTFPNNAIMTVWGRQAEY